MEDEATAEYIRQGLQLLTLAAHDPAGATEELRHRIIAVDPETVSGSAAIDALTQSGNEAILLAYGILNVGQVMLAALTEATGETKAEAMQRIGVEVAQWLDGG